MGDGTAAGTELSVFDISLSRTEAGDALVQHPTILSVEPDQISSEGGETVRIFGVALDSLSESSDVRVQIGFGQSVVARVVNSTEVVCTAPRILSGGSSSEKSQGHFVLVRVTNLVDFWSNAVQLFVETPPQALAVFPGAGPSCGGTTVSVLGRNFVSSVSLVCMFNGGDGNVTSTATWRSPELVECVSPPWSLPDGADSVDVAFALGNKGENQGVLLSYRFANSIVVTTISPAMGPAEGGTDVTISGENLSGYDLACVINGQKVSPALQDDDFIKCVVPPRRSPRERTFKIKVVQKSDFSIRYELIDSYVTTTVKEVFDPTSQARPILESDAIVLPLVRGHQYWIDQTDESNVGHPVALSPDVDGTHSVDGEAWTKGVQRLSMLAGSSADDDDNVDGAGAGVVSFVVPMDAPDMLFLYSETSAGLEGDIAMILTDDVVHTSVTVVAAHGSACDPPGHPFRCVPLFNDGCGSASHIPTAVAYWKPSRPGLMYMFSTACTMMCLCAAPPPLQRFG